MRFKLLIATFLVVNLTNCAFKKDAAPNPLQNKSHGAEATTKEQLLFEAVKGSSYEKVHELIADFKTEQIQKLEADGLTLLEVALQRGNAPITNLLLKNGASAFVKGQASGVKPYQQIKDLPADVATAVGHAIQEPFFAEVISTNSAQQSWSKLQSWGMNCTDLLNIHSYFGIFMGVSSPKVETIAINYCEGLLDLQYHNNWVMSELVSQIRFKPLYTGFIFYLSKIRDLNTSRLELKTNDGKFIMTPYSLLSLALHLPSLQESHERIKILLNALTPDKHGIVFHPTNQPLLIRSYYPEMATEAEIEDLGTKLLMATSPLALPNFPNCLQHCHAIDSLDIH